MYSEVRPRVAQKDLCVNHVLPSKTKHFNVAKEDSFLVHITQKIANKTTEINLLIFNFSSQAAWLLISFVARLDFSFSSFSCRLSFSCHHRISCLRMNVSIAAWVPW